MSFLGVGAIRNTSAATAPTGSFTCASNTTDITLTLTWANATYGVSAWRYGMSSPLYSSSSVSGTNIKVDGNAQNASNATFNYEFRTKNASGAIVILQKKSCSTKPKPATVSIGCATVTTSSITVNVKYANPDLSTNLYMGSTLAISYPKGSATTTRTQSSLAASTSYTFKLDPGAAGAPVQVTCTTADPPVAPPPPPADTGSGDTTNPGTGGGGTTNPDPGTSEPDPTPLDTGTTDGSSDGVDVYSDGSTDSTTGVDGVTVDGSADPSSTNTNTDSGSSASSSNNDSTSSGSTGSRLNGKKTSTTKLVASALVVIGLMTVAFFGWLFIRSRRLNAEQSYDYNNTAYAPPIDAPQAVTGADFMASTFEVPTASQQIPLPPPVAAPIASNKMESIINSTFYPGQTQPAVPGEGPKDSEPLDMFEVAEQYPTSFGNSHVISPLTPTAADLANTPPVFTPMPTTFTPSEPTSLPEPALEPYTPPAEPAEPEPVAQADGTLDLHPARVTPTQTPAEDLIPLPPMPTDVPAAGDVISPGQLPKL